MTKLKANERDGAVDMLRIVAMFMVVVLHVTILTGTRYLSYEHHSVAIWISYIYQSPVIVAVNLFAMLTGYLCVDKKWKIKRGIIICFQSAFYILLVGFYKLLFGETVNPLQLLISLFPLTSSYWYVAAYIALFPLMPFINRGLQALTQRECLSLCTLLILTFSIFGFSSVETLAADGHCVLWLGVMYTCGAYIKLHPIKFCQHKPVLFRTALLSVFVFCCMLGCLVLWLSGEYKVLLFLHYQSPIVCLGAISLFLIIIHLRIKSSWVCKILMFLSPMAFGVYLFHCAIWARLAKLISRYAEQTHYPWWLILVFSIAIYVLGTLVDYIRIKLFQWWRIPHLCQYLASKMPACIRQMEEW